MSTSPKAEESVVRLQDQKAEIMEARRRKAAAQLDQWQRSASLCAPPLVRVNVLMSEALRHEKRRLDELCDRGELDRETASRLLNDAKVSYRSLLMEVKKAIAQRSQLVTDAETVAQQAVASLSAMYPWSDSILSALDVWHPALEGHAMRGNVCVGESGHTVVLSFAAMQPCAQLKFDCGVRRKMEVVEDVNLRAAQQKAEEEVNNNCTTQLCYDPMLSRTFCITSPCASFC